MRASAELEERARLDERQVRELHALYQGEWWTAGRRLEDVRRMLASSDVVCALCDPRSGRLLAFARALTDRVYKALVLDVIVAPGHRAAGLGRRLMEALLARPELAGVRDVELYCLPELIPFYRRFGFSPDLGGVGALRLRRPGPHA